VHWVRHVFGGNLYGSLDVISHVHRGSFTGLYSIFNPSVLFAEFLATCSVDTVGMFAPMFGYAPGMYGRIVHEPFKS